jgi:glutathione S-transferase
VTRLTKLITIPFSHYCEKARWALDACGVAFREDGHLPLFHYLPTRLAGGRRTVPVLVTDDRKTIPDSTDIVAWADAQKPGTLLPADEVTRADALHLEDDFDRHLGPATRRWAYFQLLPRKDLDHLLVHGVPTWQRLALKVARPLAVRLMVRGLKIDAAGAERSRAKIDETFSLVGELLDDGRRYLVGNRFSIADLTFAALAAPVVLPAEYPAKLPPVDEFTGEARDQVEAWRVSRAGKFALRLYATERTARQRSAA